VWGLERACLKLGVKIFENTHVEWLEHTRGAMIVHTPYGSVYAQKVALATNVFRSLVKRAHKYVVPVYDFQLVTEPLTKEQMKSIGWDGREGLSEAGNQFHYYRLTQDNEILWGGYDAIYNFRGKVRQEYETDAETYAHLAEAFLETFPQLNGVKFTHGWGGAIDTCSRFSPFWGKAYGGRVAYVLGFTGLGVGSTRFGAQVMLDLLDKVDNERTRLKMVRRKPLPFPPEPLKFIFIRFTQWSINRADENQGKRNLWLRLLDVLGLGFDS
jgi:glycine/D-amino acid oxidase-like deaminating enzyme